MSTLVNLLIQYLPTFLAAAKEFPELMKFVATLHDIFKRNKLWTPEQEQAFDTRVANAKNDPAWQTDLPPNP